MPSGRWIMLVAQEPFDSGPNRFCKLLPLMSIEGERVEEGEFANDGEVWWMVTSQTTHLAVPGNLVLGIIEIAPEFDPYAKKSSQYQVVWSFPDHRLNS